MIFTDEHKVFMFVGNIIGLNNCEFCRIRCLTSRRSHLTQKITEASSSRFCYFIDPNSSISFSTRHFDHRLIPTTSWNGIWSIKIKWMLERTEKNGFCWFVPVFLSLLRFVGTASVGLWKPTTKRENMCFQGVRQVSDNPVTRTIRGQNGNYAGQQ